jgi:NAD(P)-dependent dehydrogenase (short-subunit alcohol dehydrogenase family)
MTQTLTGRTVVVTGGFGFLGGALAARLVKEGARVVLVDRSAVPAQALPDVALALGGVDLGSPESADAAFSRIAGELGGIDALVNVAGGFVWETVEAGSIESWDRMYGMNLRTAVVASQAVLPHLLAKGAGRLVNVGALAASKAATGHGRLRGLQGRRGAAHRSPRRRAQGQGCHRQCGTAEHHRHAHQPCRHARCRCHPFGSAPLRWRL